MPRSAIIWTRSRELSLKARYHLTHRIMISWSKCRPLNRSCAEVGSVIPAVIVGYRAFQQFAPEPVLPGLVITAILLLRWKPVAFILAPVLMVFVILMLVAVAGMIGALIFKGLATEQQFL